MATNFKDDELITRKVNGQSKVFPVVGGRLRLAHEENQNLSLQTELVSWDGQYAVFKCSAVTTKGNFVGYGTANNQRDARLSESLIELAETRSVARALRFAGFGMEYTGAEEVSHTAAAEPIREQRLNKSPEQPLDIIDSNNKPDTKTELRDTLGRITQAQVRALYALSKKARYSDDDIQSMLRPFNASTFQELSREAASKLISYLHTEVAA
jgi:hypothetical protein